MKKITLIIACLICVSPSIEAAWPTTADSAIFVDFGLFPYVAVDPVDQSVFVIYVMNGALFSKKYDRYGGPLWGGNRTTLGDTTEMFGRVVGNLPRQWGSVVPDGNGGLFICWQDYRNAQYNGSTPITNDIYLQYVDADGIVTMGPNGKRLNTLRNEGHLLGDMKTDFHGGVYVGFSQDTTTSMCVIKRIQVDGSVLWERYFDEVSARIVATNSQSEVFVNLISHPPGRRQKLDLTGNKLWPDTLNGQIPSSPFYFSGQAFADGSGGAYGLSRSILEIRFNKVFADGSTFFDGDTIYPPNNLPFHYATDGDNGMFLQSRVDKPLRRLRSDGTFTLSDSVFFTTDSMWTGMKGIISDKEGGVIGVATTGINTNGSFMLAQRLDSTGQAVLQSEGIVFHSSPYQFEGAANSDVSMASDGRGGIVVSWVLNFQGLRIYIKQMSRDGIIGDALTGINDPEEMLPDDFSLSQNFPNPFNSTTHITYRLERNAAVNLSVYNLLGQKVATLVNKTQVAGSYKTTFEASGLASGIYFYRMTINSATTLHRKMLLIN